MIEGNELVAGVWLFRGDPSGRNFGVAFGDEGALVIDAPASPVGQAALERFLGEEGREVLAVAYTYEPELATVLNRWPGAAVFTPAIFESRSPLLSSLSGWEAVPLYRQGDEARMALYNVWEQVLFCGDMLADVLHNEGIPSLAGGSQGYIDSLTAVRALDVKLLAPRRGTPATGKRAIRQRIENDHNYLYEVRGRVINSILSDVTLERVLEVTRTLHEDFPFLQDHLANLRAVWDELSAKE